MNRTESVEFPGPASWSIRTQWMLVIIFQNYNDKISIAMDWKVENVTPLFKQD